MNKKAKANPILWLLVVVVVILFVTAGSLTSWWGLAKPAATGATGQSLPSGKEGDLGSLKYSARTVSDATPAQIAITGYCWDKAAPTELIESSSGKLLSATAGTTFANAFRGSSYECTAFDSTHYCLHDSNIMGNEGLNLRSDCSNLSTSSQVQVTLYERDAVESAGSENLVVQAGGSKTFNKFLVTVNQSYKTLPAKAICFKTSTSTSHIQNLVVAGLTIDDKPSSSYDYCFSLPTEVVIDKTTGYEKIFNNPITVYADSTGFGTPETVTWTLMDACEYVSDSGAVFKDYFQRQTSSRSDCGMSNVQGTFTLTAA